MYEFLAALPAVLGLSGFVVFHLLRKNQEGDRITGRIISKLRAKRGEVEAAKYAGLSPRQLERRIAREQAAGELVDRQDFELLRQSLQQQFVRGLFVDSTAAVLVLASTLLFVFAPKSGAALTISGISLLDEMPQASGVLVDLDDLRLTWRADGPSEDVSVSLEDLASGKRTAELRASSAEEAVVFPAETYAPVLFTRELHKQNRLRANIRSTSNRFTSDEFSVRVGIKIAIAGFPDKVKVMARIDNTPIDFYDFEAKVLIPKKNSLDFLSFEGFKYGENDRPIEDPNDLVWSDIRLAYFGPDDARIVRPEFLGLAEPSATSDQRNRDVAPSARTGFRAADNLILDKGAGGDQRRTQTSG